VRHARRMGGSNEIPEPPCTPPKVSWT
jgi:hypothetical protein